LNWSIWTRFVRVKSLSSRESESKTTLREHQSTDRGMNRPRPPYQAQYKSSEESSTDLRTSSKRPPLKNSYSKNTTSWEMTSQAMTSNTNNLYCTWERNQKREDWRLSARPMTIESIPTWKRRSCPNTRLLKAKLETRIWNDWIKDYKCIDYCCLKSLVYCDLALFINFVCT